jgi:hypothetical protein
MSGRFVVLIPGHGARVKGLRWSPGATCGDLQEASQVRLLARVLATGLTTAGVPHIVADPQGIADGHPHPLRQYSGRAEAGIEAAKKAGFKKVLVLHLHLNASGGDYGLVIYDSRSPGEKKVAAPVVEAIKRWGGPALSKVKNDGDEGYDNARNIHNETWAAGRLFPGIDVSSLVLEPAFIDQPKHAKLCADEGMFSLARELIAVLTEPEPELGSPTQLPANPFATLTVDR